MIHPPLPPPLQAPYMRETLAMSAAHPVYIDTAVSIHLLHKAAYATVFEDYGLRYVLPPYLYLTFNIIKTCNHHQQG